MASANPPVAVSAPGKVLLAGGYLVLDRDFNGLVFGLSARIHVLVRPLATGSGVSLSEIIVKSPQFLGATWEYGYRLTELGGGIEVTQLRARATEALHRNPFVETALSYALTYISALTSQRIEPASITILADNDYYSAGPGDVQAPGERFKSFNVPLWEAHKTGLGSSAALVTAFTGAVLSHYLPDNVFSLATDEGRLRLHNLAQAAHCAAQGKVGSGFDVASAVFGSCLYRRFSPSLLSAHGEPSAAGFADALRNLVDQTEPSRKWDTVITKSAIKVPDGIRLVMCDVDCGSQTPGMVKQVLAWREEKAGEANVLWAELQKSNEALAAELVELSESKSRDYGKLKGCIAEIRRLIREMSRQSGVPIEPAEQTALLDACSQVPGVIGGVVPGAGGYDASCAALRPSQTCQACLKDAVDPDLPSERSPSAQVPPYSQRSLNPVRTCL
ncbi:Phosphomevalonate kinase eukaryotic [Neofusicoccum parvum]|uniref:Phosphomevalonate kinase n=1 Tax=Botryosphaeria parva (strain UCR-NP2) TaxID=1287680 RepID=R1FX35_BOTPV|nr:putative phosphomevalonate kinase protein [Neofusicoccum parvum UCRNP2]GME66247.1 Phosphomevalonate kinase eukaryotic [Neofusicoccum parvum]